MAEAGDPNLTDKDLKLMKHLDETVVRGAESAGEKRNAERLIDHGVVERDDQGFLRLTVKGKRLLRARNAQSRDRRLV